MKNLIIISLIACLFSACSSYSSMTKAKNNVKKIELGMSKKEVVSIMGKVYEVAGASITREGIRVETLKYEGGSIDGVVDRYYFFTFEDNVLVEWHTQPLTYDQQHSVY